MQRGKIKKATDVWESARSSASAVREPESTDHDFCPTAARSRKSGLAPPLCSARTSVSGETKIRPDSEPNRGARTSGQTGGLKQVRYTKV